MNSNEESSDSVLPTGAIGGVESLGAVVHPFDIEVQDFEVYGLVLDVRPTINHAMDHIPGALCLPPEDVPEGTGLYAAEPGVRIPPAPGTGLPPAIEKCLARLAPDAQVLVYCGRGGLDSLPVAALLRARGIKVDVLAGGWINYRRWVQAGLDLLPRMVEFRALATAFSGEAQRVLAALAHLGHQVIDIDELIRQALLNADALPPVAVQPLFESLLLQGLRGLDARLPVWGADCVGRMRGLALPANLAHALHRAPMACLVVPDAARMAAWVADQAKVAVDASVGALHGVVCWRAELQQGESAVRGASYSSLPSPESLALASAQAAEFEGLMKAADERAASRVLHLPDLVVGDLSMTTLLKVAGRWVRSVGGTAA